MLNLPGYQVGALLFQSANTNIYRGIRKSDGLLIVLKTLGSGPSTPKRRARLRHEYEILAGLALPGIARCHALEDGAHHGVLVLADSGGRSLRDTLAGHAMPLDRFLDVAIKVTEALNAIHEAGIIHKDVTPGNIVVNPWDGAVELIDFGLASRLPRTSLGLRSPNLLEGTLLYLSPEQTGRMNRVIDYRSDFYSLGMTCYEMLTGTAAFAAIDDPLELVHSHIARTVVPPHELNPQVPVVLSQIVLKLVAKTAEQRYQSAYGLLCDLRSCKEQFQISGRIGDFDLGRHDISHHLLLPQQLYGRETETAALLAAFERTSRGTVELILINGYSGIGKSSLVSEIHKPVVRQRGYFAGGKFDQLRRDIPYQPIAAALDELILAILVAGDESITRFRKSLLAALGLNAHVLLQLVPRLAHLVGNPADVPVFGFIDSQQRLSDVFRRFCGVFAALGHPLVLFLDDLQWADPASLTLLKMVLCASTPGLLLIGAYRDNETTPTHPLLLTLDEIKKAGVTPIHTLTLQPLASPHILQFVVDTVHRSEAEVRPFAELLEQKTQGNPFFLGQLLAELYQTHLLSFDAQAGRWQWDLEQIQKARITDNVVDLMIGRVAKLAMRSQEVLQLAACVGSNFSLSVLAVIDQHLPEETTGALWSALKEGLIVQTADSEYRFLHDRVQQAAYSMIQEEQRQRVRLQIGRLLWRAEGDRVLGERLFDILSHLEAGSSLLTDPAERIAIARLALDGGRRALRVMATEAAHRALSFGVELLPPESWYSLHDLSFQLFGELAQCELLAANYGQLEKLVHTLRQHAESRYERTEVTHRQVGILLMLGRPESVRPGLDCLRQYEIVVPDEPDDETVAELIRQVKQELGTRAVLDLLHVPLATDPEDEALARLLLALNAAAYMSSIQMIRTVGIISGLLALRRGVTRYSAAFYALLGVQLAGAEDYQLAHDFGTLACALLDRYDNPEIRGRVLFSYSATLGFYRNHAREDLERLNSAVQACLQSGDVGYAPCAIAFLVDVMWYVGRPLSEALAEATKWLRYVQKHSELFMWLQLQSAIYGFLCLLGQLSSDSRNAAIVDVAALPDAFRGSAPFLRGLHVEHMSRVHYILGDFAAAAAVSAETEEHLPLLLPHFQGCEHYFYQSLILLSLLPKATAAERATHLGLIARNQQKLKTLAEGAPMNYAHKHLLVDAELAGLAGKRWEAMDLYDQSITSATEHGYIQNAAIANECAGRFFLRLGRLTQARAYLAEAYRQYEFWGAQAKTKQMFEEYQFLLSFGADLHAVHSAKKLTTTSLILENEQGLNMLTVAKAAQAISSEIHMGPLLARLLRIVIENAGAERGFIILYRDNELWIEASGDTRGDKVEVLRSLPVRGCQDLAEAIVRYVERTGEAVVLSSAAAEGSFATDPYVASRGIKSILCMPTVNQGKLSGIVYLENNLTQGAFSTERLEVLRILSTQIAISIDNASLYANLEQKVEKRTAELRHAQERLLVLEREATERQLAGGFAHEMRNALAGPRALMFRMLGSGQDRAENESKDESMPAVARRKLEAIYEVVQSKLASEPLEQVESLLQSIYDDQEYLGKCLPIIDKAICRGLSITQQIMNYAKLDKDPSPSEAVDLADVISEVMTDLQAQLGSAEIRAELEIGHAAQTLQGWEQQVHSVVKNLVLNAYAALIDNKRTHQDGRLLRLTTKCMEKGVQLEVMDTGIGIEPENLERIFEPFYTTKPDTGTGLGLALVKKIVTLHGGTIAVHSEVGKGTRIAVIWPHDIRI